ncbi:MAG TPA: 2Fe-2S iron-sulfur cluster-binding protein [Xanthomonadaceae bacterium]|nr:2Fe-2S iron-sulfur cluster-binding protein [Xanthomonadaceae bacterium]
MEKPSPSHRVRLAGSDRSFAADYGETVLAAARRQGLALPYSCLAGHCGSCKARVIEGDWHYPFLPPEALSTEEKARGQALLCQAVPLSDLVLSAREVASVADMAPRVIDVRVDELQQVAVDVMRAWLALPERLSYLAGQYLDVLLADGRRRAFSIANAPESDGDRLELHIRHVPGGGFTEQVFSTLKPGDVLRVEAPMGTFVAREDSERPLLFVAGGTGFAPIKALIEHFQHLGTRRPMHLYWGARDASELYLRELAADWHAAGRLHFEAVVEREDETVVRTGQVHEAVLADWPELSAFDVYMSGPPGLIDVARRAFPAAGLPEDRLFYDSFDYAPDVLAAVLAQRAGLAHAPTPRS